MKPETIAAIQREHQEFPSCGGIPARSPQDIEAVETNLGVTFSKEYRDFLLYFGGCDLGRRTVYGIYLPIRFQGNPQYDRSNDFSFLVGAATLHYRSQGWPGVGAWYIVSSDYSGNPIGIAPDGSVWISDHNQMTTEKLYNGFEEWLLGDCLMPNEDADDEVDDA